MTEYAYLFGRPIKTDQRLYLHLITRAIQAAASTQPGKSRWFWKGPPQLDHDEDYANSI